MDFTWLGLNQENGMKLMSKLSATPAKTKIYRIKESPLNWVYDGDCWSAASTVHDEGVPFSWRIVMSENGVFRVNASDSELTTWEGQYLTLHEAKMYCAIEENVLRLGRPQWINEDELPDEYPYSALWAHSRIIDGVRMFPIAEFEEIDVEFQADPK